MHDSHGICGHDPIWLPEGEDTKDLIEGHKYVRAPWLDQPEEKPSLPDAIAALKGFRKEVKKVKHNKSKHENCQQGCYCEVNGTRYCRKKNE